MQNNSVNEQYRSQSTLNKKDGNGIRVNTPSQRNRGVSPNPSSKAQQQKQAFFMHRMSNSNANLKHIIKNYKEDKDKDVSQHASNINSNSEVNSQLHPKQIPQKKHSKKGSM